MYSQQDDEFPEYGCLEHDWGISNEPCPYCTEDDPENSVWLNGVRLGKATESSAIWYSIFNGTVWLCCMYCGGGLQEVEPGNYEHKPDCPVRRALEYLRKPL